MLLIAAVIGASMFIYNWLYTNSPGAESYASALRACLNAHTLTSPLDLQGVIAGADALRDCRAPIEQRLVPWLVVGVALLLGLAGVIYWTFPARKIRRDRLEPISPDDAAEVVAYLATLCREAGLAQTPVFLWDPLNPARSGLAFGRRGRYYVVLPGGLITQFYTDAPAFRAVVLHELAHLRNADVDKTYFSLAIWQAFVVTALIPFAVSLVDNTPAEIFTLGWRALALVALVYLIRNAVLRTREVYADVRASVWDGPAGGLARALEHLPPPPRGRWRALLRVHPAPEERRQALDDTRPLFRMGAWDALATGTAAAIAFPHVASFVSSLTAAVRQTSLAAPIGASLVFAPLVVGVVGLGAWRGAFVALAERERPRDGRRLGLWLGVGFLLGDLLSFDAAFATSGGPSLFVSPLVFALKVLWSLVLVFSLMLFLQWIEAGASTWLDVALAGPSPRPVYIAGLTLAGGLLTLWFGLLSLLAASSPLAPSSDTLDGVIASASTLLFLLPRAAVSLLMQPVTLLAFVSLWGFPLAAQWWRREIPGPAGSHWAFLHATSGALPWHPQPALRLRAALTTGMKGGLIFCVLLLAVRFGLRLVLSEAARRTDEFALTIFFGQIAFAVLAQAGVMAVVAARATGLGTLQGLCAAFVAGSVMAAGALGVNLLLGGKISLGFAWQTFGLTVNAGAALALLVGLGVSVALGVRKKLTGE